MKKYYMFMLVWCVGFFAFDLVVAVIAAISGDYNSALWDFAFAIIMVAFFVVNYIGYKDTVAVKKEEK